MKTNITKKIILGSIITLGLFSAAKAQSAYDDQGYYNEQQQQPQYVQPAPQYTQPAPAPAYGDQSFYYYPDANVYFDINCNRWVYNNGYGWITVNVLPASFNLYNASRYMVYHRGPQVWLDNAIHIRNFFRPAYRPAVAYNNFHREDFGRREDFRRDDFRGGGRDFHDSGRDFRGGGRDFHGGHEGGGHRR